MRIKVYCRILIVFTYSLFSLELSGQPFDTILKKLNAEYPQEKLYLHYDKEAYLPGETIWFKAYLFAGNFPSEVSKVMYADLIDDKGCILQHKILPIFHSSSAGSFIIPFEIDGEINVRCYTKWMLNFDSTLLYEKTLPVIKTKLGITNSNSTIRLSSVYKLEFFPEGGSLIEGVESRIAFKATDEFGNPVSVNGSISNNTDNSTISFQSSHDGMGTFRMIPLKNTAYMATWRQGNEVSETKLPTPLKSGLVLEINNVENDIQYTIKSSDTQPISQFVYLVAQMNQQLVYRAKISIQREEITSGKIPITQLPSGVIQLTVFTPDKIPIIERLVFTNLKHCSFSVNVNTSNFFTSPRSRNTIEIEVPESISSNLSISVTANNTPSHKIYENIYTKLLLDADIRGYIHNPGFYFSNADSASYYLDLVMMTNGWRRFKWLEVLAGQFISLSYKPETSIVVDGEITGLSKEELQSNELIGVVELKSGKKYFLNTPIKVDGKFSFINLAFYDSANLYYQINNDKKGYLTKKLSIKTFKNVIEEGVKIPLKGTTTSDPVTSISDNPYGHQLYEENRKRIDSVNAKTLLGVTVTAKNKSKKELLNEEYTSGAFEELINCKTIIPDDDPSFLTSPSFFDYLQSRYAGIQVNPDANEDPISWRGFPTALFVNEISQQVISLRNFKLVEDASLIRSLAMSEIALVKIFSPPFVGATGNGPGGCIAVYLKKTSTRNQEKPKQFERIFGFSPSKEFYDPDYAKDSTRIEPDFRNTLYWNPFVMTDKQNHKVSCTFYTNDLGGPTKIIIEGCNEEGKLIRIEKNVK